MAIYRLEAKIVSRAKRGRSVIAAAAYRAGTAIKDELRDKTFDFARRAIGVVHSAILAPAGAPAWVFDQGQLWNTVEKSEKRVDAQLAREFVLALPRELSKEAQFALATGWADKELVKAGMVVEISVHHPKNGKNPHAHILCTMRKIDRDGFSSKKPREWNDKNLLRHQRASWADAVNAALEENGINARVDHRSLKDRGIDREPEPKIGVAATAMKRRGLIADPFNFQRVRKIRLWNQVTPIAKAMQAEPVGFGLNIWEKTIHFAEQLKQQASKAVYGVWRMLIGQQPPNTTGKTPNRD